MSTGRVAGMKSWRKPFVGAAVSSGAQMAVIYFVLFSLFPPVEASFLERLPFALAASLLGGTVSGLLLGAAWVAVLLPMLIARHRRAVKRIAPWATEADMGVCHMRRIEVDCGYDGAFRRAISALQRIRKCRVQKEDKASGRIEARVGMSWKSAGEIISMEVRATGNHRTQIEVLSRPASPRTWVDYGKNLENTEKVAGFLRGIRS